MIIVAGGDSFVWGSELSDHRNGGPDGYSHLTFPAKLANGNPYICAAYPGISNTHIAERIQYLLDTPDTSIIECVIIICWTWPSRDSGPLSRLAIADTQTMIKHYGIPYLFTCADNCLLEWLDDDTDWNNWFLFPPGEEWQTTTPRGFYQWAIENKYQVGPQGHPLEMAHQDAVELIKEKFNEVVKKHLEQTSSRNQIS
jgi:hypothetical protein